MRPRSFDDSLLDRTTSSYHTDDLLATLAETGTPLDTPIQLRGDEASVRELAESALRDFNLARHEYEWTAIAYARYVFPQKRWKNKYGETISVDASAGVDIDASGLRCKFAEVDAGVGSSVRVHTAERVVADAGMGASIRVSGSPKEVQKHAALGGSVSVGN